MPPLPSSSWKYSQKCPKCNIGNIGWATLAQIAFSPSSEVSPPRLFPDFFAWRAGAGSTPANIDGIWSSPNLANLGASYWVKITMCRQTSIAWRSPTVLGALMHGTGWPGRRGPNIAHLKSHIAPKSTLLLHNLRKKYRQKPKIWAFSTFLLPNFFAQRTKISPKFPIWTMKSPTLPFSHGRGLSTAV